MIDMLLKANPEVAKCENENLVHRICRCTRANLFKSCISLLVVNEDALKKSDIVGELPNHCSANYNDLAAVQHLLKIDPESAYIVNWNGVSVLQRAVLDDKNNTAVVEEKVHERSSDGYTVLHFTFLLLEYNGISAICKAIKQVIRDKVIRSVPTQAF